MTPEPLAPDPDRAGSDRPLPTARPSAPPLVNPPSPDIAHRHGRRRAGGRPRHADALAAAQGPPPAVRPADAGLRPRRLGQHGRRSGRAAAGHRLLAAGRGDPDVVRRARHLRAPGRRRAAPATRSGAALAAVPADATEILVLSGDVPLVTGGGPRRGPRGAPRRTTPRSPSPASTPPTRPQLGRVVRGEFGTVERIVEAKDATADELDGNEINAGALRLRCRLAAAPDRGAEPVRRDRRAVPDRAGPARPRGRPDRQRGRLRGRRPVRRHQRPLRSSPPPSGACGSGSTRRTCATA